MTRRQARFYSIWFVVHCLFVLLVAANETFTDLAQGLTIAPGSLQKIWRTGERVTSTALAQKLNYRNPARRAFYAYLQSTGIEGGYGYFGPNVPDGCELLFEFHYPDGRVEYELPLVSSSAAGLRVASLLEKLARPGYEPIREYTIRLITDSVWREHPNASFVRALFGSIKLPSRAGYEKGDRESFEVSFAYDFSPSKSSNDSISP